MQFKNIFALPFPCHSQQSVVRRTEILKRVGKKDLAAIYPIYGIFHLAGDETAQ